MLYNCLNTNLGGHSMVYRDFKGLKLSGLGMGNMRLPVVDGDDGKIDYAEAERIIDYAYEHGVN